MIASVPIVALTVLSLLNLILLLGVVRRLNQLAARGPADAPAVAEDESPLPAPGTKVADFAVVTTAGDPVRGGDLVGRTLVAFFAEKCPLCAEFVPRFISYASAFPGGRDQVLAVVAASTEGSPGFVDELGEVARVVVEPFGGRVSAAFGIDAFPGFCLLAGNVVLAAEFKIELLRLPDPAAPR